MDRFLTWWQHLPENIDPVIFQIGGFELRYYGLMYIAAFGCAYALARYRLKIEPGWNLTVEDLQGVLTAIIIGLMAGARLGYVLFYNPGYYLQHPLEIILPFEFRNGFEFTGFSGMSYHGGLIGCIAAAFWYIRKNKLNFTRTADLVVPGIPAGYTFGRIGNFINGELWGRMTTSPVGMYFPDAPGDLPRHPSQLYEAFGEGIVLFIILWRVRNRIRIPGAMLALYLIGYGIIRFIIEFFRQPDAHLGLVLFGFSMGQLLCLAMIAAGAVLLTWQAFVHRHSGGA